MSTINDLKAKSLRALGYTGSIDDMYRSYLRAISGSSLNSVDDLEKLVLGGSGSINDRWKAHLDISGIRGRAMDNMLREYWGTLGAGALGTSYLFRNNEVGVWYDPSDLSTMYQNSTGTTPVTAVGQSVGLLLDKSKGLVLGPELVTNGSFNTDISGWPNTGTAVWAAGEMNIPVDAANQSASQNITVTPNVFQKVTIGKVQNGYVYLYDGTSDVSPVLISSPLTAAGSVIVKPSGTTLRVRLFSLAAQNSYFDNISVRELPGYHATQATSTARPILARHPIGGRRNLYTYTEEFDNAYWDKTLGAITANTTAAPDGAATADTFTATGAYGNVRKVVSSTATAFTVSWYVKAGNFDKTELVVGDSAAYTNFVAVLFDIQSGAYVSQRSGGAGYSVSSYSITDAGNGWYRAVVSVATPSAASHIFGIGTSATSVNGSTIHCWGAQLEASATSTAYQKVVSTYDVTEAGVNDVYYLKFDGVDDFMVTPSIDFTGTDKMSVFAGVRKLSDAARGIVVELSSGGLAGAFNISAPAGASATYSIFSGGSLAVGPINSPANYVAPISNVLTFQSSIGTDQMSLLVDGLSSITSSSDQGTGNFGNYPLYIGMRAGTSLPFNGHLYSLVARGALSDAAQITAAESYVNSRTGAY